jgi:acetyltransferase-like isoleucine patch superfamily enzyme
MRGAARAHRPARVARHRVWLVAANAALLELGDDVQVAATACSTAGTAFHRGGFLAGGFVYLNSSDHKIEPGRLIREQGYTGAAIAIGPDNWLGGHSFICKGVRTGAASWWGPGPWSPNPSRRGHRRGQSRAPAAPPGEPRRGQSATEARHDA